MHINNIVTVVAKGVYYLVIAAHDFTLVSNGCVVMMGHREK